MEFEWDDAKSHRNQEARGLPFDVAVALFDSETLEDIDDRRDYGERRVRAIGVVRDECLVCVYVDREDVRRIISLRRANKRERDDYREAFEA
jgi:uncharacterized DUF497 family protein